MATFTTQVPTLAGLAPVYSAASAGGDRAECGDRNFLHVKNGSASAVTVTLATTGAVRGQSVAPVTVSVPASGERMIGPLAGELFAGAADGLAAVSWSATATVTAAAFRI
ncbi:hypothetical protein [Kitasatospora sp. CB02891]|uniref:hypothetical protein n=1 Tax=Kitasatospora sp. CB02891 TaxID=2020329 RepID=UPI001E2C2522|nr:hypothetical protein [Kitasatospora sp. CB02891]